MKRIITSLFLSGLLLCGYAQTYHTLQVGGKTTAAVGYMDYLNPHCAFKSAGTNQAYVYGVSRGTAFSIDRSLNLHIYKVVDVIDIKIPDNLILSKGDTYTYSPIITDAEANTTLTWTSSNTSVATVNSNGVVSTVGTGQTVITCTASNGISALSVITVNPVLVSSVSFNEHEYQINVNETAQPIATILPANASSANVKWLSTNENIAQVDNEGNVTAIGSGYCSIYAIAEDGSGKFDKCLIYVQGREAVKGDTNGDGEVTPQDASLILQFLARKITW